MHFLVKLYASVLVVGLSLPFIGNSAAGGSVTKNVSTNQTDALKVTQEKQAKKYGAVNRTVGEIAGQITLDRYTQSEALVQVESVRKTLSAQLRGMIIPYLNIMADCVVKEVIYKDTHYVFYHAVSKQHVLLQDLY